MYYKVLLDGKSFHGGELSVMYDIDYQELADDIANDELIAALWQEEFENESRIADSYPHDKRWEQAVENVRRMQ